MAVGLSFPALEMFLKLAYFQHPVFGALVLGLEDRSFRLDKLDCRTQALLYILATLRKTPTQKSRALI